MTPLLPTATALLGAPAPSASPAPRPLPVVPPSPSFWLPTPSSTSAAYVDGLFTALLLFAAVAALATLVAMIAATLRRGPGHEGAPPPAERGARRAARALIGSCLPLGLVAALLARDAEGYLDLRVAPRDALEIRVAARRYTWRFTYPNGLADDTLHVPIDTPVHLIVTSDDGTHGLSLPAFRAKADAVPGRENELWFEATEVGQFPAFCSEHCGPDPVAMNAIVVVHAPDGYEKWLETREQEAMTKDPVALGEELYRKHACATCHSIDGRPLVGPTLRGVFDREIVLADGGSVRANEAYLRESLLQPQARIVKGFAPAMPTYQGRLDDTEAAGLVAYMKTLR